MMFLIFGLGYAVFAPLGEYQVYRLWVMGALIIAIGIYLWRDMDLLVRAFDRHILDKVWANSGQ